MEAHCINKENGCAHVGIVESLKDHEEGCCYTYSECPLKCGTRVLYKDLMNHLSILCEKRIVKCCYCQNDLMLSSEEIHNQTCLEYPVSCPHCSEEFKRCQLSQHDEECNKKIVSCKFEEIGCKFTEEKGKMCQHESLDNHAVLFLSRFKEFDSIKNEIQLQQDQQDSTTAELRTLREKIDCDIQLQQDSTTAELKRLSEKIDCEIQLKQDSTTAELRTLREKIDCEIQLQQDSTTAELKTLREKIDCMKEEHDRSIQDTEHSLEELKSVEDLTVEKIKTFEKHLAEEQSKSEVESKFLLNPSVSHANTSFKSTSTPKKRNEGICLNCDVDIICKKHRVKKLTRAT